MPPSITPTLALPVTVLAPMMPTVTIVTAMVPTMMPVTVQKLVTDVPNGPMSPGASLRDRATLSSPLRGLAPSGGYPSRLRSLTLTPRSAWPAARQARRRCRNDVIAPRLDRTARRTAAVSSRALRAALVCDVASLALAGCAGSGHRLRSSRRHSVRRR